MPDNLSDLLFYGINGEAERVLAQRLVVRPWRDYRSGFLNCLGRDRAGLCRPFQNLDALGGFHLRQFAGLGFSVYNCKHFFRPRLFQNLDALGWFDLRQFAGLGFSP